MKPLIFRTPSTDKENKFLKRELSLRIAENIRKIRVDKQMTQQQVAEKAGYI